MTSYKHKDLSKAFGKGRANPFSPAISEESSEKQTTSCVPEAPIQPTTSRSNRFSEPFFDTEKQLKVFCHNLCINSPDNLMKLLDELSNARGHGRVKWDLIPHDDCEDGRGLLTVSCCAGKLSHTMDGGDGTARSKQLAGQTCAMGMMILMGVKRSDIKGPFLDEIQDKSIIQRKQERRAGVKSAVQSVSSAGDPYKWCRTKVDRYIREERLLSSSKGTGKQKLKRYLPEDCDEIQRTIFLPNPFAPVSVKSEPLDEKFPVNPFQLAEAEPFPVINAETLELVKAEPSQSVKDEPIIPVLTTEQIQSAPWPFIKVEPPRDENLEDYSFYTA